jgi:hypothetical protein
MFGDWSGSWGWMWGVCWIFVILFWAVIIFGLAALAGPLLASGVRQPTAAAVDGSTS